jgi:hypothetical protein
MRVIDSIEEARFCLSRGNERRAAEILIAAIPNADPADLGQIEMIASDMGERAGWFGRRRWEQVKRLAEEQEASAGSSAAQG